MSSSSSSSSSSSKKGSDEKKGEGKFRMQLKGNDEKKRGRSESKRKANPGTSTETEEEKLKKLKRLEAWKKAKEELNLALKEEEETKKSNAAKEGEGSSNAAGGGGTAVSEGMEMTDKSNSNNENEPEGGNSTMDEVDPLDAFMSNIETELKETAPSNKHLDNVAIAGDSEEEAEFEEAEPFNEETILKKWKKREILESQLKKVGEYLPFTKNLYVEVPEITQLSEEETDELRKQLDSIRIRGRGCPKPIRHFSQCGLSSKILETMSRHGYTAPTPIQCQAIPAIMSGRDVIGIAKTGSGKTLAFLLPLLRQIQNQPPLEPGDGPIGLIMAPTRELAQQIHAEAKKFAKPLHLRVVCCFGGAPISDQIAELKRGAEIIVATPGRLIDLLCVNNGKVTNLFRVTMVILDEADRMFDLGFEPQIMTVINNVRPDRQVLMFSATFPWQVEKAARQIMQKPLEITAGGRSVVCSDVEEHIEVIEEDNKWRRLLELLKDYYEMGQILIFVDRQESVDFLFLRLMQASYDCLTLHGGQNQQDRSFTLKTFKAGEKKILVATSVAARGLDVVDLNLVVNYDVPNHLEDYVHRVGRTGRAGRKGTAFTFITPNEDQFAPDMVKALEDSEVEVPAPLRALCQHYQTKKFIMGDRLKGHSNGYITKGYTFGEEDELKRQEGKKLEKLAYGIVEEIEIEEKAPVDSDGEDEDATAATHREAGAGEPTGATTTTAAATSVQKKDIATAKVESLVAKLKGEQLKKPAAATEAAKLDTDGLIIAVEINDYPQNVRWKATNRETLSQITEMTGAAIIVKGNYVPPDRQPPPGVSKLYLHIEGLTRQTVESARLEVLRMLQDSIQSPQAMYSLQSFNRYTVK